MSLYFSWHKLHQTDSEAGFSSIFWETCPLDIPVNKAVLELVPTSSDLRGGRLEATRIAGYNCEAHCTSKAVVVQFEIYLHYEQDMGHELEHFSQWGHEIGIWQQLKRLEFSCSVFGCRFLGFRESSYNLEEGAIWNISTAFRIQGGTSKWKDYSQSETPGKPKKALIGVAESWGEWKHFSLREVGRIYHISCLFRYFPGWENLILSESWIMNHELTQKLSVPGWCNPPNSLAIFIVKSFTVWILRCPVTSKRAPQSCVSASWGYFILVLSSPLYKCIKKDLTCQKREHAMGSQPVSGGRFLGWGKVPGFQFWSRFQ